MSEVEDEGSWLMIWWSHRVGIRPNVGLEHIGLLGKHAGRLVGGAAELRYAYCYLCLPQYSDVGG